MLLEWLVEFWWILFPLVGISLFSPTKASAISTAQQSISFNPILTLNSPESRIQPTIEQGGVTAIPTSVQREDTRLRAAVAFQSPNARVDAGGNEARLPLSSNSGAGFFGGGPAFGPDETSLASEVGSKGFLGGLGFVEGEFPFLPLLLIAGGGAALFFIVKK